MNTVIKKRPLGDTGLRVSSIGLGCVTFGREIDAADSFTVLDHARESGINLLDTAAAYHAGASESVLGDWMRSRGCRDEVVVATKVHKPLTREHIVQSAEESLIRLRVDVVDLFQVHAWDESTPLEETLAVLADLRDAGKIRQAGCSNWSAANLAQANELEAGLIKSIQPPYNLVQREIESETLPRCAETGIGVISYSPLAAGFLTGKYRPGGEIPQGTRFDIIPGHQPIYFTETGWRILDGLTKIANREHCSLVSLALGWVMSRPGISSVLVGARHPGHIDQALGSVHEPLPDGVADELSRL
ncbi:MAG: aldo/keto reductase [Verrucomicrobiae bacterium]|nr:aldo/keto reductase [Verrucomicrobiae bacterium]